MNNKAQHDTISVGTNAISAIVARAMQAAHAIGIQQHKNAQVIALNGTHPTIASFLGAISGDAGVLSLAVVVFGSGDSRFAHFECTREQLAFASVVLAQKSLEDYP